MTPRRMDRAHHEEEDSPAEFGPIDCHVKDSRQAGTDTPFFGSWWTLQAASQQMGSVPIANH